MPETYRISIDHEEENEESLSITGKVNGYQCGVVINKLVLVGRTKKQAEDYKDRELVKAFKARATTTRPQAGREVTV